MVALADAKGEARRRPQRIHRQLRLVPVFPSRKIPNTGPTFNDDDRARVALTFADGPSADVTPAFSHALDNSGVKATFFLCGAAAVRYTAIMRDIANRGHGVENRTSDHPFLVGLPPSFWADQITRTTDVLQDLTGMIVRPFRPPCGRVNQRVLAWLADHDMLPVLWSSVDYDWIEGNPKRIEDHAVGQVQPVEFVLLHCAAGEFLRRPHRRCKHQTEDRMPSLHVVPPIITSLSSLDLTPVSLPQPTLGHARRTYRRPYPLRSTRAGIR